MRCTSLLSRISASLALAGALACAPALRAQQSIQLFLSAVDENGKPITDLRAEDVTIQVDGSLCKTTKFDEINWPVKLHLLVDNGPVHNDALRQLREALRLFLAELPTDMEVTIVSIDPAPRFIYKAGSDRIKMLSSLDLLIPDSGAPKFIDAMAEAADRVNKDKTDKNKEKGNYFPVFMMVGSAGVEGSSPRDYQINKLFKQVQDNAITVHVVMQQSSNRSVDIAMRASRTRSLFSLSNSATCAPRCGVTTRIPWPPSRQAGCTSDSRSPTHQDREKSMSNACAASRNSLRPGLRQSQGPLSCG